ncbi:lytic polysaccharide monooxygenase [Streptomyces sp. NPDC050287]|uniref:lytic polysaccharide monooxygenase n=1 Tax=Streptomyces sp. NPDC050287 TaxID=3365608 RepID=UPI0037BD3DFE
MPARPRRPSRPDPVGPDRAVHRARARLTFEYRVTAPHKGAFKVYVTQADYAPTRPLAWDDLDLEHPVAASGFSPFSAALPERTGR